ncbi:MAG: alpha/beta hydrolase [Acidobacteriota bacterium]|nr:alpha/beta hydrolase [Acidobacteriota bacterium]
MPIPCPGRLVGNLHVLAKGDGRPIVVLEAGIAASSLSWAAVQDRVAAFARVLSYDRAGFGWSAEDNRPGTAADAAEALAAMLAESGERGPFIAVGHSFGGLIVRIFQQRFPDRVAGMVLVDPVVRTEWRNLEEGRRRMLARGVNLSRRGALLARLGVVRATLSLLMSGSRRVPQLMAKISAGKGAPVTNRLAGEVRKMPRELWPAIAQHWSEAKSFRAMANNLENLPVSVAQLDEMRSMGDLPLIVLSAGKGNPEHERESRLSTRGELVRVPAAGHWIQLDDPDAVVLAIRQTVERVREA